MAGPSRPPIVPVEHPVASGVSGEVEIKYTYKYENGKREFETEAEAQNYWGTFISLYNKCKKNAKMIKYCKEIELSVGLLYGMIHGLIESYSFTIGCLNNAVGETSTGNNESNLRDVNGEISNLSSSLSQDKSTFDGWLTSFDTINGQIGIAGERMIEYHRKIYPEYKDSSENVVGLTPEHFYAGGE